MEVTHCGNLHVVRQHEEVDYVLLSQMCIMSLYLKTFLATLISNHVSHTYPCWSYQGLHQAMLY